MEAWIIAALIAAAAVVTGCVVNSRSQRGTQQTARTAAPAQTARPAPRPATQARGTETGPMVYYANDRHGGRDREYRFNYKLVNGSWRAYILRMPSLGSRDPGSVPTHRLYDNGRAYICWDSRVTTLKDMQNISRAWADSIQEYIATGKRFGPGHN